MFPKLAGGVAIFAHEAWKRYTSFVGPIAAVGYWLGWSVVLAISGLIVGQLLQNQFYTGSEAAGSSWTHHQSLILGVNFDLNFPIFVGIFLIACIWIANVFGVRPAVWVGYVTGGAAARSRSPSSSSCRTSRATGARRTSTTTSTSRARSRGTRASGS